LSKRVEFHRDHCWGQLLFLIFVNDLPDWVKSSIKMFADDTKLWATISNTTDSKMLQEDLNRLKC